MKHRTTVKHRNKENHSSFLFFCFLDYRGQGEGSEGESDEGKSKIHDLIFTALFLFQLEVMLLVKMMNRKMCREMKMMTMKVMKHLESKNKSHSIENIFDHPFINTFTHTQLTYVLFSFFFSVKKYSFFLFLCVTFNVSLLLLLLFCCSLARTDVWLMYHQQLSFVFVR